MKNFLLTTLCIAGVVVFANAQTPEKQTKGEKFKEAIKNLPEELIKQPEAAEDTNANKLINDNLYFEVHPLWKEKGTLSIIEYKMLKCDVEPLNATFPLPDKKLAQGLTINLNTIKKTAAEKKQLVLAEVQKHLIAYYKEAGKTVTKEELATQTNAMIAGSEAFTTNEGRAGEIYFIHDVQPLQSGLTVLLLLPGADSKSVTFVQVSYFRYLYETTLPEDVMELRMFTYPDDQEAYIDFSKKMLKTLVIK